MIEVILVSNKKEAMNVLNHFYPDYKYKDKFINDLFTSYEDSGPVIHINNTLYPSYSDIDFVKSHLNRYTLIDYKNFLSKYKKISTSKHVKQLQFESVNKTIWKKGDRVELIKDFQHAKKGSKGTVLKKIIDDYDFHDKNIGISDVISVRWDESNGLYHSCEGLCEYRHGWNVPGNFLKKEYKNSKHVKQLQFESVNNKIKIGDTVVVKENYKYYLYDYPETKSKIADVIGLKGKVIQFYHTEDWVAVEFDKEVRTQNRGYDGWAPIDNFKKNLKNTLWFNVKYLEKVNSSKYVKQLNFESIKKENEMSKLTERLEKILINKKILKEEAYEVTVNRNDGPKLAPILTGLRNVTVTKSFDLNDLVRHRFMISSRIDSDHIESMLKDELKRKKVPININDIKVSLATPKSLEEALVK